MKLPRNFLEIRNERSTFDFRNRFFQNDLLFNFHEIILREKPTKDFRIKKRKFSVLLTQQYQDKEMISNIANVLRSVICTRQRIKLSWIITRLLYCQPQHTRWFIHTVIQSNCSCFESIIYSYWILYYRE